MTTAADNLINLIGQAIIDPLFLLFFSLALLIFVWGAFVYVLKADDVEERKKGGRAMFFGIIGMVIMFTALGIINLLSATIEAFVAK